MTAASHFLTTTSALQCPHGGPVTGSTRNTRVKADQNFVLRSTDTFTVAGCSYTIGTVPHPCVRVQWDVHAERHQSHGDPSLTEDSVGYCLAADGAMQGTVVVSSTQIRGAAT
jgi:hypothetical protein